MHPPRRRRAAALLFATSMLAATVAALLGSPAGATTITYVGRTSGTQSTVTTNRGSQFERVINPEGTITAVLDDTAGTLVSATTSFAPAFTPTFTGPFGLLLYVRADLEQLGSSSGTATPSSTSGITNVAVTNTTRLRVTVYRTLDGTQRPATDQKLTDPAKCYADLSLRLTGTANRRTGDLSVSQDPFTIPQFPNGTPDPARTCGLATGSLNQQLAGANNSIVLNFTGGPTRAHYTGVSRGTSSTVVVRKGDPIFQRTLNPTGTIVADIDFTTGAVTNTVARFDPVTIKALPGILSSLPAWARINLTTIGTPTATLTPSGTAGIDNITVRTTARMAVTVLALDPNTGLKLTDPARCFVDVALTLQGTVDRGTDQLRLAQDPFRIPSFPAWGGCGLLLGPGLSLMVSGPANSISLNYVDGPVPA
ncbi:MAG: hypothetical protein HYX34_01340 [Actinobacteria bacterium]|nr:hypothetical protein [Actinomycetota bacterium]